MQKSDERKKEIPSSVWEELVKQPGIEYAGVVPTTNYLPNLIDLGKMSDAALLDFLQQYQVVSPMTRAIEQAAEYVQRMSAIPPGSPMFEEAVLALADERGLRRLARETKKNHEMAIATDGNPEQRLLRICEDDERSCEVCLSKSGLEMTWAEHISIGVSDCLGGGDCRCEFIAVEY